MNFQHIKLTLLSVYWEQRNRGRLWSIWLVFGLACIGAGIPLLFDGDQPYAWELALALFALIVAFNLVLVWFFFSFNLVRLAAPATRQLVPEQSGSLRMTYMLFWLTITTLISLLLLCVGATFVASFIGVGAGLLLLTMTWGVGNALWGLPLYTYPLWLSETKEYAKAISAQHGALPMLLAGAVFLSCLLAVTLHHAFGKKGDPAYAAHAKSRKRIAEVSQVGLSKEAFDWSKKSIAQWFYDRILNRIVDRQKNESRGDAATMMSLGFGRQFHWSNMLGILAVIIAGGLLTRLLPSYIGQSLTVTNGIGLSFGSFIAFMVAAQGMQTALISLHQTRKEQQLLMLLPGVPSPRETNRVLVAMLFRLGCKSIALGMACGWLFVVAISGELPPELFINTLVTGLTSSAMFFLVFFDYARMHNPGPRFVGFMMLGMPCAIGVAIVNAATRDVVQAIAFSLGVLAISLFYAWHRWRIAPQLPPALPVGRLAD